MRNFSLETKIIILSTSLILLITAIFVAILSYEEVKDTKEAVGKRALETAIAVSVTPSIVRALEMGDPQGVIQPFAEYLRKQVGAEFIVVGDRNSIRYSHPNPQKIGGTMVGGDNARALTEGKYYISEATGSLGPSLRGKAPIYTGDGEIIGLVSVGYLIEDINDIIFGNVFEVLRYTLVVLAFGIFGSILLAKNIRKETMGLEPREIATLYRDREALLSSILEGVIAIDNQGRITAINQSAQNLMGIGESALNAYIEDVMPNFKMKEVLRNGYSVKNEEILIKDKVLIFNRTQIIDNGEVVGAVATFRDKTEVQSMLKTLSEIQQYSEGLRAQTHEYMNKLYAISGLLQLNQIREATELIQSETDYQENHSKQMLNLIEDTKVQAILLGKMGKASEQKVKLSIDENSSLRSLPEHIDITKVIHIVGNLIDNAIEEVVKKSVKEVSFFITDLGNDVIIEVEDSGDGIADEDIQRIFEVGFSTKGRTDRGYGLVIVKQAIEELKGTIEVHSRVESGTVFTVYIPKQPGEVA